MNRIDKLFPMDSEEDTLKVFAELRDLKAKGMHGENLITCSIMDGAFITATRLDFDQSLTNDNITKQLCSERTKIIKEDEYKFMQNTVKELKRMAEKCGLDLQEDFKELDEIVDGYQQEKSKFVS